MKQKLEDRLAAKWNDQQLLEEYSKLDLSEENIDLLRQYFRSMANLYGVISLKSAYRIIRRQMSDPPTQKQFRQFARIAAHEPGLEVASDAEIYGWIDMTDQHVFSRPQIIADGINLRDGTDLFNKMKEGQRGKKLRILPQDELLRYQDPDYTENTPQRVELMMYLKSLENPQQIDISALLAKARRVAQLPGGDGIRDALDAVLDSGLAFKNLDEPGQESIESINAVLGLLAPFLNGARSWVNRGASPIELSTQMYGSDGRPEIARIEIGPNIRAAIANGDLDPQEYMDGIDQMDHLSPEIRDDMKRQIREAAAHKKR